MLNTLEELLETVPWADRWPWIVSGLIAFFASVIGPRLVAASCIIGPMHGHLRRKALQILVTPIAAVTCTSAAFLQYQPRRFLLECSFVLILVVIWAAIYAAFVPHQLRRVLPENVEMRPPEIRFYYFLWGVLVGLPVISLSFLCQSALSGPVGPSTPIHSGVAIFQAGIAWLTITSAGLWKSCRRSLGLAGLGDLSSVQKLFLLLPGALIGLSASVALIFGTLFSPDRARGPGAEEVVPLVGLGAALLSPCVVFFGEERYMKLLSVSYAHYLIWLIAAVCPLLFLASGVGK